MRRRRERRAPRVSVRFVPPPRDRDHERVRRACARASLRSPHGRLPPLPPPARRHPGLRRRRRCVDRTGVRRPGLPAHGGRRAGGHATAVAGRNPRGVDVDARGRGGGLRRRGGRWFRAAADLVGRRPLPRLDAVGRRARPHLRRAVARPVDLGVGRPGGRRRPAAARARAAVRPGAVGRLARGAAGHDPVAGVGVVEALPRRDGREAVVGRRGLGRVRPAPRRDRRPARVADAGGRPAGVPVRPRGLGQPLLRRPVGGRPASPHRPRRPRRARVLRAAREHRRRPGRVRVGRRAVDPRLPRVGSPAARRPARRPPHGPGAAPDHHVRVAVRCGARPDGPDERRQRPRHRPPAHPPRRSGPDPDRRAGCPRPAGRAAGRRPGRLGGRRGRRGGRDRRPDGPARRGGPAAGPVLRRRAGAATGGGPGRPERRRGDARREAAARRSLRWWGRGARAGPRSRRRDLGSRLVARLAVARVHRSDRGGDQPDRRDAAGRRRAGRGHRAPIRRPLPDLHRGRPLPGLPVAAQLRPDLRPAFVRPHVPGVLAAVPRPVGRPHARPVRREPRRASHLARRREGRRPARPRPRRPVRGGRRERPEAGQGHGEEVAAGGRDRRRRAGRPGRADPGGRGPLLQHERR